VHSKLNFFYLFALTLAHFSISDLISAILDDPSCQKPSQTDIDAMKAAVGAIFTSFEASLTSVYFFQRSSKKRLTARK
jgi:hypothetical protein